MQKWLKIEEFLNRLLVKFYELLALVLNRSTPEKVKNKIQKGQKNLGAKKEKINKSIAQSKDKSVSFLVNYKNILNLISSKFRVLVALFLEKVNTLKSKKIKPLELFMLVGAFLAPLLYKAKNWWLSLRPETIALGIMGMATLGLTTLGLITSTKNIAEKQGIAREPAAKVENATAISTRPHYYKLDEKHLKVLNVMVPIYVGGSNDLRSLRADLTIVPSNKYIKEYLFENEYLIQDKLNSSIQPLVPEFPLEREGKQIVKEKVREEINELLHELEIKGEIKEVHIDSLLAN